MSAVTEKKLQEQVKAFADNKVKQCKNNDKTRNIEVSLYYTGGRDIL